MAFLLPSWVADADVDVVTASPEEARAAAPSVAAADVAAEVPEDAAPEGIAGAESDDEAIFSEVVASPLSDAKVNLSLDVLFVGFPAPSVDCGDVAWEADPVLSP